MKLNRQVQVTSRDNHRSWFIRQGAVLRRELCAVCDEQIQVIRLEEAAVAAGVELAKIYTLIEAGRLHSVETDEAQLVVCLNSLVNFRMNPD
jgi:DNA-binding TFAR19-related protein (PDSD5 family)